MGVRSVHASLRSRSIGDGHAVRRGGRTRSRRRRRARPVPAVPRPRRAGHRRHHRRGAGALRRRAAEPVRSGDRGGHDPGRGRHRHQRHPPLGPPHPRGEGAGCRRRARRVPVLQQAIAGRHRGPCPGDRRRQRSAGDGVRHPGPHRSQDHDGDAVAAGPRGADRPGPEGRRRQPGGDGGADQLGAGRLRGLQRRRPDDAAA